MQKVSYRLNGIEVNTYKEKLALEEKYGKRAKVVFTDIHTKTTLPKKLPRDYIGQA